MRAFILIIALCVAAAASAQSVIAWSEQRPLDWEDFQGAVPGHADAERVAETTASLAWSYEYSLEFSRSACRYRITSIESSAEFHPATSWVRPDHRTARVLQHEQGHFDIAQRYKLIFDDETQDLVGRDRTCRPGSERRATRDAQRSIEQLLGSIYDDVWNRYRAEQDAYDSETHHGIDLEAQALWTQRLATLKGETDAD